jgi:hypothetical protein
VNFTTGRGYNADGRTRIVARERAKIETVTLSISISPQAEAKLKEKAAAAGVDVETYVSRHLELMASRPQSLHEISGPVAESVARSGMSEDELAEFLETEKHAMRAERRAKQGG